MGTNQRKHRLLIRQTVLLVALLAAGYFGVRAYLDSAGAADFVKIRFQDAAGSFTPYFNAEVAATGPERAKGLMFRRLNDMPEDRGMLFIFPEEIVRRFWMKNTLIPLDMIFISADLNVVGVVPNTTPLSEEPRGVEKPSKYVVELLGGMAKKFGVAAGSKIELPARLPAPR